MLQPKVCMEVQFENSDPNKSLLYLYHPFQSAWIWECWDSMRSALWHGTPCPAAAVCCRQCSGEFDPCVFWRDAELDLRGVESQVLGRLSTTQVELEWICTFLYLN